MVVITARNHTAAKTLLVFLVIYYFVYSVQIYFGVKSDFHPLYT